MKMSCLVFTALLFAAVSCQKTVPKKVQQQAVYLNVSTGSSWSYHEIDSSATIPVISDYTLTCKSTDTLIDNKTYHIYSNSAGGFQYLNLTGDDYYQFDSLPAGLGAAAFENLYLKDNVAVGTNWTQNLSVMVPGFPILVPLTISYSIAEKGISRTVNGQIYSNVIHVTTAISSSAIPAADLTTNINMYYAPNFGLIDNSTIVNLNYSGVMEHVNIKAQLTNATLL